MTRFHAGAILATVSTVFAALTLIWPEWIEALGFDLDHGSGSLEWILVGMFGIVAILAALWSRRGFRRAHPVAR